VIHQDDPVIDRHSAQDHDTQPGVRVKGSAGEIEKNRYPDHGKGYGKENGYGVDKGLKE